MPAKTKTAPSALAPLFGPSGIGLEAPEPLPVRLSFPLPPHTKFRASGARWVGTNFCVVRRDVVAPEALQRGPYTALPEHPNIDVEIAKLLTSTLAPGVPLRWVQHAGVSIPFIFFCDAKGGDERCADEIDSLEHVASGDWVRCGIRLSAYSAAGSSEARFIDASVGMPSVVYAASAAPDAFANHPDTAQATQLVARFVSHWEPLPRVAKLLVKGEHAAASIISHVCAMAEAMVLPDPAADQRLVESLKAVDVRGTPHASLIEQALMPGFPCRYGDMVEVRNRILKALR